MKSWPGMNNVLGGGSRQLPAAGHEAGRERKNSTRRAARLLLGVPQICWKSEQWGFRHVSHHQELLEMSTLRSVSGLDPCTAQPHGTKSQAIAGVHEAEPQPPLRRDAGSSVLPGANTASPQDKAS